jgi:hypothetical protein
MTSNDAPCWPPGQSGGRWFSRSHHDLHIRTLSLLRLISPPLLCDVIEKDQEIPRSSSSWRRNVGFPCNQLARGSTGDRTRPSRPLSSVGESQSTFQAETLGPENFNVQPCCMLLQVLVPSEVFDMCRGL